MTSAILEQHVNEAIEKTTLLFIDTPNVFLTEDDFRMHLCSNLLKDFGEIMRTGDQDYSIPLHTEVRWYGNGKLKYRSDIVLIDVSTLDVLRSSKLPSKGYGFNIPKAIIELKLRRPNGASDNQFIKSIQHDINKLIQLKDVFYESQGQNQTQFWVLFFDKKDHIKNANDRLNVPDYVNFIYKSKSIATHRTV